MTIGETIQRLRTKRRLSQEQLAELVGVSRQAVSKWELNAALPDTDKLVPLARALGVSVDELLGNVSENGVSEAPSPERPPRQPDWLATHWYWLGLVLMAVGLYQLIQLAPKDNENPHNTHKTTESPIMPAQAIIVFTMFFRRTSPP